MSKKFRSNNCRIPFRRIYLDLSVRGTLVNNLEFSSLTLNLNWQHDVEAMSGRAAMCRLEQTLLAMHVSPYSFRIIVDLDHLQSNMPDIGLWIFLQEHFYFRLLNQSLPFAPIKWLEFGHMPWFFHCIYIWDYACLSPLQDCQLQLCEDWKMSYLSFYF